MQDQRLPESGRVVLLRILFAAVLLGLVPALHATELEPLLSYTGPQLYQRFCASCHGKNGTGGGSFAEVLQVSIPDLTTLSGKNGGVFPIARVYNVIDGREAFKAHGTREMPVWGKHLSYRAAPEYDDYGYESDVFVRARILAVIDYLYRLQAK